MSKRKSKALVSSDSEDDLESTSIKTEINNETDSDDDSDQFEQNTEKLTSSTRIEPRSTTDGKLELVKVIRQLSVSKLKHGTAVKRLPWDFITIEGFSKEEMGAMLKEIVRETPTIRTLDEVLADYEVNYKKYESKSHPDFPKLPMNAGMNYFQENRDKITQQVQKLNPGREVPYPEVFKFAMDTFKKMPEKKREPYLAKHKEQGLAHKLNLKEFYKNHPELKIRKGKPLAAPKAPKPTKAEKARLKIQEPTSLTPISLYRKEISTNGNLYSYPLVLKMWRELPDEAKAKYISEVLSSTSDVKKTVSSIEMKILDAVNGLPKPPLKPYNIFVIQQKKEYMGDSKDFLKHVGTAWKKVSAKEKEELQKLSNLSQAEYCQKMEAYIRTLPEEQHQMMFSKHKIYQLKHTNREKQQVNNSIKKKARALPSDDKESSDEDVAPPKKKQKNDESSQKESQSKTVKKNIESPLKMKISESSPEVSPKKNVKSSLDTTTINSPKKNGESSKEASSPKKKSKMISESSDSSPEVSSKKSPKKNVKETTTNKTNGVEVSSPKKKSKKISESSDSSDSKAMNESKYKISESSPEVTKTKKKALKKKKLKEPEYPSQSTAHYFMTSVYTGKPDKVAKAYKKLDVSEKAKLSKQMKSLRIEYLMAAKLYLASLDANETAAFKRKIGEDRDKQMESTPWHADTGTDNEKNKNDSSSDESDSDSS